ncbi:MAG: tetratricopeptide repeat-containing sulfotransferase family protein [Candidatus Puniceispirillales bacterium]
MADFATIKHLCSLGRHQEAISAAKKMLKHSPSSPQAKAGFAFAHFQAGKIAVALKTYRELHRRFPDNVDFLFGLALSFERTGELARAEDCYRRLTVLQPNNIVFPVNLGVLLRRLGRYDESIEQLRQAAAIGPDKTEVINNLAITYQYQEDYDKALETYATVMEQNPRHYRALSNMGVIQTALGNLDAAQRFYEQALDIQPDYLKALNNLGLIHVYKGEIDQAEATFRKAIAIKPDAGKVYNSLINLVLNKSSLDDETKALFTDLEHRIRSRADLVEADHAAFALGRFYEKQKDAEKARDYYQKGNDFVSRQRPYDDRRNVRQMDAITARAATLPAYDPGENTGKGLLFIVGMPRSGTTLLESIIASHPDIVAGDELLHLDHICFQELLDKDRHKTPVTTEMLQRIAEYYLSKTAPLRRDGMMMIDKLPHNFQWVDIILKIFPEAKVLHSYRDAMDNCWSLYKTFFENGHAYSFGLKTSGQYYAHYQHFMARMHARQGDRLLAVNYDEVVADPVAASQPVFDFIGCPDFSYDEASRGDDYFSRTASSVQVQQPITTGSVGGWRRHEAFLQPVLAALLKQQERYGLPQYGDGGFPFRVASSAP